MRRVILSEWMSLDGVVQSAGSDDDTSDGFRHGGWHVPYMDNSAVEWVTAGLNDAGGLLFGRRTYELLAGYWLHAREEEAEMAQPFELSFRSMWRQQDF